MFRFCTVTPPEFCISKVWKGAIADARLIIEASSPSPRIIKECPEVHGNVDVIMYSPAGM